LEIVDVVEANSAEPVPVWSGAGLCARLARDHRVAMAKRKKGYRLSLGTGMYTVSGGNVRHAKMTAAKKRQLRSLLRDIGAGHHIEQIPLLATRKAGRPKKRR
jgi:hypothetical protein